MLQTARFYARLYYHTQTRAHNLLRQKVITDWVSAIVGYILTDNINDTQHPLKDTNNESPAPK